MDDDLPLPRELLEKLGLDPDDLPDDTPEMAPNQVGFLLRSIGRMLSQSDSFRQLSPEQQAALRSNTAQIADALETEISSKTLAEAEANAGNAPPPGPEKPAPTPTFGGLDPFAISF